MIGGKAGTVKPRTKTGRIKVIPIIPEIEKALKPQHMGRFVFMKIYRESLIPFLSQGLAVNAAISVSDARRVALTGLGQTVPNLQRIRALIDTGASSTCVD